MPYQKGLAVRGAPQDLGIISHVSTATKWVIGPRKFPHPKKNGNPNQNNQRQANTRARPGYVHYTAVEEVPTREVVTAGMFLVNKHPAVVLFDSGV